MHRGAVAAECDSTRHGPHRRGRRMRRDGPALGSPAGSGPAWETRNTKPTTTRRIPGRRMGLVTFGLLGFGVAGSVVGAVITRLVHSVAADRNNFNLPRPRASAPPIPADVQPNSVALPSFITASADFYRVDTALTVPQLSHGDWRLRIRGMVDREATYSFDDLTGFDVVEKVTTLTCVSNPVGGRLISTGIWTGYRVADLLAVAGVHADADMMLSTSIDGFTAGTPVEALTDGRDALLAIGLNGQPLPSEHGYPARLLVPGLYGYVSATKWVVELESTRFDRAKAYWTRQGGHRAHPLRPSRGSTCRKVVRTCRWSCGVRWGRVGTESRRAGR